MDAHITRTLSSHQVKTLLAIQAHDLVDNSTWPSAGGLQGVAVEHTSPVVPGAPTRSKKRQRKGRANSGSTAANVLMQPLPDGAMPEVIETRGEHDYGIVKELHEAIALAQANPRWPDPWLVAAVASGQKAVDRFVHRLKTL